VRTNLFSIKKANRALKTSYNESPDVAIGKINGSEPIRRNLFLILKRGIKPLASVILQKWPMFLAQRCGIGFPEKTALMHTLS
jgi:hypothetical protein